MNGPCLEEHWYCLSCFHDTNCVSLLTSSRVLVDSFQVVREAVPVFAITVFDAGFAEEVFKV